MTAGSSAHRERARSRAPVTKLAPPQLPVTGSIETRASRLIAGPLAPVTLVVAPPGAGKTVTLSTWARTTHTLAGRVAWATLDTGDDDVTSLWVTLLAALRANRTLASDPRVAELSSAPAAAGVDASLVARLGAVFASEDRPFVLVLDDVHTITDRAALGSIELLLRQRPPGLSLVLSARYQPALALHQLRMQAAVREIGPADFVMDLDGAASLLASLGHHLDRRQVEVLWRRTEGWVAALRLAAFEVDRGVDPHEAARGFGGTTPAVAELLASEVLDQFPADVRGFLVATGVCRELTPTLAERLTGRVDAGAILDDLHRRNALTQRLATPEGSEPTYRYHDLLRDFLSDELYRTDLPRWRRIHGDLADWHADRHQWRRALEHAVDSDELTTVREVLRHAAIGMVLDGDAPLLERVLADAPRAWQTDAVVGAVLATAALARFDPAAADRYLAPLHPVAAGDVPAEDRWLDTLRATIALYRSRLGPEVSVALDAAIAAGVGDSGETDLDLLGRVQVGVAHSRLGQHDEAQQVLVRALDLATASEQDVSRMACLGSLATIATIRGRAADADRFITTALDIAHTRGWYGSPIALQHQLLSVWWALLRADLGPARAQLDELPSLAPMGSPDMDIGVAGVRSLVDHLEGVPARASATRLRSAWEHVGDAETTPEIACMLIPWEVKLWLADDDVLAARAASRRRLADLDGTAEELLMRALIARAAGSRTGQIRRSLEPALDGRAPSRMAFHDVWVWMLEAQLAAEVGAVPASYDALVRAVRSAEPDSLVGLLVAFGPETRRLLTASLGRFGRHEPFVAEVLDRWRGGSTPAGVAGLTPAERAIVEDLPTYRTTAEIASLHGVSVNTVKTHLKSIYRKLEVTSRRDAVDRARARGLL